MTLIRWTTAPSSWLRERTALSQVCAVGREAGDDHLLTSTQMVDFLLPAPVIFASLLHSLGAHCRAPRTSVLTQQLQFPCRVAEVKDTTKTSFVVGSLNTQRVAIETRVATAVTMCRPRSVLRPVFFFRPAVECKGPWTVKLPLGNVEGLFVLTTLCILMGVHSAPVRVLCGVILGISGDDFTERMSEKRQKVFRSRL